MPFNSYTRDGDTFNFTDPETGETVPGQGPVALQKAQQIDALRSPAAQALPQVQPSPELVAAAQPGADLRLAQAAPVGMGVGGNANPFGPRRSLSDAVGSLFGAGGEKTPEQKAKYAEEVRKVDESRVAAGLPAINREGDQTLKAAREPEPGPKAPGDIAPSKVQMAGQPAAGGGPRIYDQPIFGLPAGGGRPGPVKTEELQTGRHTQGTIVPEADKEALVGAEGSQMAAQQAVTSADQQRAQLVAAATVEENRKLLQEQQASQARMAQARAEYQSRVAAVDKLNQEVQNTGIHSYWENKSNGEKFVSALSVALGVLGAGMQGRGPSDAASLQILNRAMDDDINRQKANLENKRAGAERAQSLLGRYHEALGDMQSAEAATKSAMLDAAARRLDEIVKSTESQKIQANGQVALAAIQKEKAQEDAKLNSLVEARTYATMRTGGGGGPATAPSFDIDQKTVVPGPNGGDVWLQNASPEDATKAKEELGHYNNLLAMGKKLRAYGSAWEHLPAEERGAAAGLAGLYEAELAKSKQIPLRGEGANMVHKAAGGDPNAFLNLGRSGALNETDQALRAQRYEVYARHRAIPVKSGYEMDAKTKKLKPAFQPAGNILQPEPDLGDALGKVPR